MHLADRVYVGEGNNIIVDTLSVNEGLTSLCSHIEDMKFIDKQYRKERDEPYRYTMYQRESKEPY